MKQYSNTSKSPTVEIKLNHFQFVISNKNNLSMSQCGLASSFGRIVGGTDAVEGSYPFVALLLRQDRPFGGAVIMNDQWILTAAHNFHRFFLGRRDFF